MSKCTKPNCDCLERAEKANGGPLKDGYQCLYNTEAVNAAKEKFRPSPSLPETEQAIDPAEARRNIPDGMDEWCEAHQSYYKYECPECAILAHPDQPVPEDVNMWVRFKEDEYSHVKSEQDAFRAGAIALYWEWMHKVENPTRASFVRFAFDCMNDRKKYKIERNILQTRLSSTEAERDAIKQAFDLKADELRKLRNQ